MADVKDLFEQGEDVTDLFNKGEDVTQAPNRYEATPLTTEPSTLEGLGYGVQKGTTLGFRDEIAALAGALGAKSGGDERDFWDVYYDVLDTVRNEGKQIEEQAPISTTVGELAGGVLTSAIPGASFGKIREGGTWLQRAGDAAKIGMKAGALTGLGTSEAKLAKGEVGKAAEDVLSSAAMGGLTAGVLQPTIEGTGAIIKGAGKFLTKQQPFTRDIVEVFNRTKGGEELLGKVQDFSDSNRNLANEIIDDLQTLRHSTGALKQETAEQLADEGVKINVKDVVDKMREKIKQLDPTLEQDKKDIDAFKKVLSNIIKEEEVKGIKFIPTPPMPKPSVEERAQKSLMKKISQAQIRDKVSGDQYKQILQQLKKEFADSGEPLTESQVGQIEGLVKAIQTAGGPRSMPITDIDTMTGLPVKYSAKMGRNTFTESLMPDDPTIFTPIKKIKDVKTIVGREEVDPQKLDEIIRSVSDFKQFAEGRVGKELAGETKSLLKQYGQQAAESAGEVPAALQEQIGQLNKQFEGIAQAQEKLNLLPYYPESGVETKYENQAINALQQAIRRADRPGSTEGQQLQEAMDLLNKAMPGLGDTYKAKIAKGSTNERLARELLQEQQLGGSIKTGFTAPKAGALNVARLAGKAVREIPEQAKMVTSKLLTEPAKIIYDASPEMLQKLQTFALNTGNAAGKSAAEVLAKINNAPDSRKKALLFTLMQQPEFRNIVQDFLGNVTGVGDDQ